MTRAPLPATLGPDLPMYSEQLIALGALLVVVGLLMVRYAGPRPVLDQRSRPRRRERRRGLHWALTGTTLIGGAITATQWTVVAPAGPAALSAITLGLPGLLAGATVTRLVLLACLHRRSPVTSERGGPR
jgi:hypothetical protein